MRERASQCGRATATRRRFLCSGLTGALLALDVRLARGAAVLAVRVWPAPDYTRVTLEFDEPLKFSQALFGDPQRLVVDLEGIDVDTALKDLLAKVQPDDPYIRQVRVGQFKPKVMRLVFDLKTEVAPQLFTLAPIANYRHRLVIDLRPTTPVDPLQTLLDDVRQRELASAEKAAAEKATERATEKTLDKAAANGDPIAALIRGQAGAIAQRNAGAGDAPSDPRATPPSAGTDTAAKRDNAAKHKPVVSRLVTIAVDAGHGGEDPGAIGSRGAREKDVVLAVARKLRERISTEPNMRAYLTRDADFFVPLGERVAKARRVGADLFISIHADGFVKSDARGASVYVLSERGASSSAARWLARQENRADLIGGVDLAHRSPEVSRMLLDLSTAAQIKDSSSLGRIVLAELGSLGRLHKADVEQAGFAVLKALDIPSILVETAFISNSREEQRLIDPRYQVELADAIFNGVRRYLIKHPPPAKSRST
jgi:N-acetylmuramoyl-L-alanine amidase